MRRTLLIVVMLLSLELLRAAPPAPGSRWQDDQSFAGVSGIYNHNTLRGTINLPDSILVLRCQFSDISFDLDPSYPPGKPDPLPHDQAYFERFMFHLSTYWHDASQGNYSLTGNNYTVYPEVFTLSKEMGYYGDDDLSTERISEMLVELLDLADDEINFSEYDSYIVFHAGAGQEADISGENEEDLWTTFVTRRTLQAGLDPENNEFMGLEYDGKYLKEFVIVPETERQPDIQENDMVFGVLGVLCHEFGRQIGLPTLYDNQSSNGKSAGIGNYGVMGTGLWNAGGFVPPLPIAWCRIYMGWEECLVIEEAVDDAEITYPQNAGSGIATAIRVNISEDEYFLLENRRQNPDGSIYVNADGDTLASFSFEIVENQQYYGEDHDYAGQPVFSFMENTYAGCEWDFYLPGYGEGDALINDGSGICIWHVDENVMREKFNLAEEINVPNGDEEHKGIDLEEADHDQGLDTYGYYGSRDDTYRAGNNDYFGYQMYNGISWNPTAESYYGGIQLEINNISAAASEMSFSVDFSWSLSGEYLGKNNLPTAFLDFGDGVEKLFYPMPDCSMYLWENNLLVAEETILRDTIPQCWAWLEDKKQILIPAAITGASSLHSLDENFDRIRQLLFVGYNWAAPPLVVEASESGETRVILALNSADANNESKVIVCDGDLDEIYSYSLSYFSIIANMMYDGALHVPGRNGDLFQLLRIGIYEESLVEEISFESDHRFSYGLISQFTETGERKILFATEDSVVVQLRKVQTGFELERIIELPFNCNSYPSYGDIDNNGSQEFIFGGENSFVAIDEKGELHRPYNEIAFPDTLGICAGVIPVDLNSDGVKEIVGMMSRNRLCIWESLKNNDYRMMRHYPVAYACRSRMYPVVIDSVIYIPADNSKIFREDSFSFIAGEVPEVYGNLARTGYVEIKQLDNTYETKDLFIDSETYIYPNPYSKIYSSIIFNGQAVSGKTGLRIMLSEDKKVKIKIYDLAGNRVETGELEVDAYIPAVYFIDAVRLASGMYFAQVNAGGEQRILKFGIEK